MDHITALEDKSILIIRETYARFRNIAMLWSLGKNSTTLLWLCKKAFPDRIPFPIIHIDTGYNFPEMYRFRDKLTRDWGIDLKVYRNEKKIKEGIGPESETRLRCCSELKKDAFKLNIDNLGCVKALLVGAIGMKKDSKDNYCSLMGWDLNGICQDKTEELLDQYKLTVEQDTYCSIYPLLNFTELDIWNYIKREHIPVVELYFSKDGKRYSDVGCFPCCSHVESNANTVADIIREIKALATSEMTESGQDKEDDEMIQRLKALGYM